jgi:hypothetical protein
MLETEMSTFVDLLPQELPHVTTESAAAVVDSGLSSVGTSACELPFFAREQIRELVHKLFFASTAPLRQVVLSAVEAETEVLPLCLQVGEVIGQHISGTVCVVDANPIGAACVPGSDLGGSDRSSANHFGMLREASRQLSKNLWLMPFQVFCGSQRDFSGVWLRARLAELRLEFDYTVLAGPAATQGDAAVFGEHSDGMVLVLRANFTRRVTAQKAKQRLSAANAHLLGTILTGRIFPIPEAIYKRL